MTLDFSPFTAEVADKMIDDHGRHVTRVKHKMAH
jgi:hypothetical protein